MVLTNQYQFSLVSIEMSEGNNIDESDKTIMEIKELRERFKVKYRALKLSKTDMELHIEKIQNPIWNY